MAPVIDTTTPERSGTATGHGHQHRQSTEPPSQRRFGRQMKLPSSRALVGSALVVVAAAGVLSAHRSATAPAGERVVVATRPIPAGTVITADDLGAVSVDMPSATTAIAAANADDVIGSRALHDLDDMDVLRPSDVADGTTDPAAGSVIVPVELDRARALKGTVHTGSRVNVLATDPDGAGTVVLATDVLVVDIDAGDADGIGATDGIGFRLGLPNTDVATAVVDASVRSQLTLVLPSSTPPAAVTNSSSENSANTSSTSAAGSQKGADRG